MPAPKKTKKPVKKGPTKGRAVASTKEHSKVDNNMDTPGTTPSTFPIAGLGASAGGLEALEVFLRNVPPLSGIAFVIIQHQDPNHKGIIVELLQRATSMPVALVTEGVRVEANCVYVIPPNRDLSMLNGVLLLSEPSAPRGLRLPIDSFLRSLAEDCNERSIGVILSGMGTDGTLGLRTIKENGGSVFVQSQESAKFDSMPRSAIEAGLADVIAPVADLPGKIVDYLQYVPILPQKANFHQQEDNVDQNSLQKIILILRTNTGHDFSLYKKNTLHRRIERRMGLHQLKRISDYVRFLRANDQEADLLFKELLIGVTGFFRDPEAWEQLKIEVFPTLFKAQPKNQTLRAWTTACSTGEEAYSLAIVFREALEKLQPANHYSLQIFATDLDREAVEKARIGLYPKNVIADVSEERLDRFFVQEDLGYRVCKEIREMVIFAPQNLVMDPPFSKIDLLTCRNLLIYLEPALQKKLLPVFHYSLNPGGFLVLGTSENLSEHRGLFTSLPGKTKIYRRQEGNGRMGLLDFPAAFAQRHHNTSNIPLEIHAPQSSPDLQTLIETLLIRSFSPAAVLTTHNGDILYSSAKTGKYLEPSVGKANLNIFAMAREGLAGPLNDAFGKAVRENTSVTLKSLNIKTNKSSQTVDVTVHSLQEPLRLRGMVLIVFEDLFVQPGIDPPKSTESALVSDVPLDELSQELELSREQLKITREEMQASQEELKSGNEELQSTNEELQSTNEELTTSKEEMQSMNEELQTVNQELTSKVQLLSQASDDMNNLLNSTDIATVFLDNQLKIRRFTTKAVEIFKLIPGDVGRPITDQVTLLHYPSMVKDAQIVLNSLVFCEKQIVAENGNWYTVRIMPYRTQDNHIDGLVLTFADITKIKKLEKTMQEAVSTLQEQIDGQSLELESTAVLKDVLREIRILLDKNIRDQTDDLSDDQIEMQEQMRRIL